MMGDFIRDWVLPLVVVDSDEGGTYVEKFLGTGFLVADGAGAGYTAAHVAKNFILGATAAMLVTEDNKWELAPVEVMDLHPTEDVAKIHVATDDRESPLRPLGEEHHQSARYRVWGYPTDAMYELFEDDRVVPRPDLVYSEGHIRRRLADSRQTLFGGHRQFELSSAAGAGCSGAPVLLDHPAHDAWQVIGVYVGQRSNETEGIKVGHAVRIGGDSWFTG